MNQPNNPNDDYTHAKVDQAGKDRDQEAVKRDERADLRDQASDARDQRADARDERAEARERAANGSNASTAADRAVAKEDRLGSGSDRTEAASDRKAASADRAASADDRVALSIDGLTHTLRREFGIVQIEREILEAKQNGKIYTLVFVDVDNLKITNDQHGHTTGDKLLRAVADAIRSQLRPDDLIMRFGGDEFVCGLLESTRDETAKRFEQVNAVLAPQKMSTTFGMAELGEADTLDGLIVRADSETIAKKRQRKRT